jgi:hypothetical protein
MSLRIDPIAWRWVAKRGGRGRQMARLSPRDARAWRDSVGDVTPMVERTLSGRVVANRVVHQDRRRMEPLARSLPRARRAAATLTAKADVVLRTDVATFYPSVDPSVLARSLRDLGASREDASVPADLVEGWSSQGYPGLPIGPPGSAVLANAVLIHVDRGLGGLRWLRWVDDYVVGLPSERAAAGVLDRIDGLFDELGLHRSEPKTHLIEGGPAIWPGGENSGTM